MGEYKIERGVKLRPATSQYPIEKLEVGDSFVIPKGEVGGSTRSYLYQLGARAGVKVAVRVEKDGGLRVWRVK
mgnify:CR=1 FL=1